MKSENLCPPAPSLESWLAQEQEDFECNDMLLINHMDLTCMHALEHFKLVIRV